jgi:1-acyl-sn-glycerol-3-phosphate acyltransferase
MPNTGTLPHASPHPVASWLLQFIGDLYIRAVYRREVIRPADFRLRPGSMVASNHQRDVDGPMLGTVLLDRRGLRFAGVLPYYVTREDLFRPGILARLAVRWPRALSGRLRRISLAWFFPLGRTEPMRRTAEFTLGDALRALAAEGLGDADAGSLLNARGHRETCTRPGERTVDALLEGDDDALEQWWGLRRLSREARATIAPGFRATVERQIAHFAARLDRGCCIYFAPEGTISRRGPFGRVRGGFYRIACAAESPPWIQPIGLAYDTLAPGKSRVVIRVGQAVRADARVRRCEFDAKLRRAVLDLVTITPSHLLARFLLHGPAEFDADELCRWLAQAHSSLSAHGAAVDPLFERTPIERLARRRLRWLCRKRLVSPGGEKFQNTCPREAPPGWRRPENVVRYLDNALSDFMPDIERLAPC